MLCLYFHRRWNLDMNSRVTINIKIRIRAQNLSLFLLCKLNNIVNWRLIPHSNMDFFCCKNSLNIFLGKIYVLFNLGTKNSWFLLILKYLQGVSFRIVYFETLAVTKLLHILITKYDFYMAKSWSFLNVFLLSQKIFQRWAQLSYENVVKYF